VDARQGDITNSPIEATEEGYIRIETALAGTVRVWLTADDRNILERSQTNSESPPVVVSSTGGPTDVGVSVGAEASEDEAQFIQGIAAGI